MDLIRRLCSIPGVEFTTATTILAEIGFDMSQFADAAHLASWAGLCPGNKEIGGKRLSGRTRKGDRYLRRILVQSCLEFLISSDNSSAFLVGGFVQSCIASFDTVKLPGEAVKWARMRHNLLITTLRLFMRAQRP